MKILQDLLRSVCHFGAGANVVCNDMKEGLSVKGRRAALTGAAALTLAAVIMTSTACGSRKAESPPDEEPSESSSIAEESSESEPSSSEEEEEDTSPKELAAGADRYKPIDIEQLKTLLNERAKKYQEDSAAKTPTAGNLEEWKQINSDVVGWLSFQEPILIIRYCIPPIRIIIPTGATIKSKAKMALSGSTRTPSLMGTATLLLQTALFTAITGPTAGPRSAGTIPVT